MKEHILLISAENGCNSRRLSPMYRLFRKDRNAGASRKTRDFIYSTFIKEVALGSEHSWELDEMARVSQRPEASPSISVSSSP